MKDSRVIALFGKSCVGKTEVATKLGESLGLPVRHCGDLIRERAKQLGVSPAALLEADHRAIDNETRSIAQNANTDIIMEGSFLDVVLAGVPTTIFFELTCEDDERKRRCVQKLSGSYSPYSTLELRDENDLKLKRILFQGRVDGTDTSERRTVSIDTTKLTAEGVAFAISEILGGLL